MLKPSEVAARLGLREWTIRRWIAQGKVAHHKLGRAVRVPESEVRRLLNETLIPCRDNKNRLAGEL